MFHSQSSLQCKRLLHLSARVAPVDPGAGPAPVPICRRASPQRLNPADYDVGFHRDDRPWRLSCLTYCLHLPQLARACGLPTVLTTDAHYARGTDRALHLICRAAGRDKPLSGYPDPEPGARCLSSTLGDRGAGLAPARTAR